MTQYAAFLRGINVGGRIIKMADLMACFETLGLQAVRTLLQSGNVLFETERAEAELKPLIEAALTEKFHYPAKVQVVSVPRLAAIVAAYPFGAPRPTQHDYVIFLENGLERTLAREAFEATAEEQVQAGEGVVYWRVDKGQTLKSSFAKLLAKPLYRDFNTNRNLNTLKKMLK